MLKNKQGVTIIKSIIIALPVRVSREFIVKVLTLYDLISIFVSRVGVVVSDDG